MSSEEEEEKVVEILEGTLQTEELLLLRHAFGGVEVYSGNDLEFQTLLPFKDIPILTLPLTQDLFLILFNPRTTTGLLLINWRTGKQRKLLRGKGKHGTYMRATKLNYPYVALMNFHHAVHVWNYETGEFVTSFKLQHGHDRPHFLYQEDLLVIGSYKFLEAYHVSKLPEVKKVFDLNLGWGEFRGLLKGKRILWETQTFLKVINYSGSAGASASGVLVHERRKQGDFDTWIVLEDGSFLFLAGITLYLYNPDTNQLTIKFSYANFDRVNKLVLHKGRVLLLGILSFRLLLPSFEVVPYEFSVAAQTAKLLVPSEFREKVLKCKVKLTFLPHLPKDLVGLITGFLYD